MPKKIFKFFFIILFTFKTINSDERYPKLVLNEIASGKLDKDDSFDFYEFYLQNTIPKNNLLVFTVRENKLEINKEDELFSDPDIYISKTFFPKNRGESDWFSEKFGYDIIAISSKVYTTSFLTLVLNPLS